MKAKFNKEAIEKCLSREQSLLGIRSPSQEYILEKKPKQKDDLYTSCRKVQWLIDDCKLSIGEAVAKVEMLALDPIDAAEIILIRLKQIEDYVIMREKKHQEY